MSNGAEESVSGAKPPVHYTPHVKSGDSLSEPLPVTVHKHAHSHSHTHSKLVGGKIFDWLAISLSALCLVHCLLTPVVLILLPTFAFFGRGDALHSTLLMILPVLALLAFVPGYFRHRNLQIFLWSLPGFVLLTIALFFLQEHIWLESAVSICGSLCLIRAHLLNRRLSECC